MTAPLLSVEDLVLDFRTRDGRVHVLDHVSLSLGPGEITGVVGESGSGKSVLAYAIMGLLDPAAEIRSGRIQLAGTDLLSAGRAPKRASGGARIAMIFQSPRTALNPIRRVGQQIEDVLLQHRTAPKAKLRSRAVEALARVGVADPERRYEAYPWQLSGGMCQRVMIAIALACEPLLLIADEPTTGLDVTTQAVVMDLIRDLVDSTGTSVLMITHDLALAGEYCDRIIVMHAGHAVETAAIGELLRRPSHPYTARLIGATPVAGSTIASLASIPGSLPDLRRELPPCRFEARCDRALASCVAAPLPEVQLSSSHFVRCWNPL